jgi:hypothetical protein
MGQVTVIKAVEGEAHVVLRMYMEADGSGELVNYPFFSPSDCNPALSNNKPTFRLMQMWGSGVWFDLSLSAGTLVPVPIWTFARDCDFHVDFRGFGGLFDQNVYTVPPPDDSGVLCLSTNGFAQAGSRGSFVFELRKRS